MRWIFTLKGKPAVRGSDGVPLAYEDEAVTGLDDPGYPLFHERAVRALNYYSRWADAMHWEKDEGVCYSLPPAPSSPDAFGTRTTNN